MAVLEIKYLKNCISDIELEYIKEHIPKRFNNSMKFLSEDARNSSLLAGILIYNNLGIEEDKLKYNSLGKPYIENGLYFNVSHSKEYIVFVKSKEKIGIDIELMDENNMSILDYVFDRDEKEYIEKGKDELTCIERLTKLWTIKESVFKASGTEKKIEPRDIVVTDDKRVSFFNEIYNIYTLKEFGHMITIASANKYEDIKLVKDKVIY